MHLVRWSLDKDGGWLLVAALLGLLGLARPLPAAEFACAAGDMACLITAIHAANVTGEAATITLAAGTYTLTGVDNDTDGPTGLPSVTSPLTLRGAGAQSTVIERAPGAPQFRLLHVAATGGLTLEGLTLRGGDATTTNAGGGIWNQGTLTLTRSTLSGNVANNGGGIFSAGPLTITNSTLSGNVANSGGGISVSSGSSPLRIANSTLHENWANGSGGGIGSLGSFGMTITNSTLQGNIANGSGGGISLAVSTLTLTHSTVSGNAASQGGGISIAGGGFLAPPSQASLGNTILAQNAVPPTGTGPDCVTGPPGPRGPGQATSQGHNLIGDPTGCNITLAPSDLTGDPGLGNFTDHGLPGQGYVPLLPTSQAIGAGDPAACPATDQLGQRRVGSCDIGAVEFQPPGTEFVTAFVTDVYLAALARFPDTSEVAYWVDVLTDEPTPDTVRGMLHVVFESPEFRQRPVNPWQYVEALYQAMLGREPDRAEMDWWVQAVLDRYNTLLPMVLDSPEFQRLVPSCQDLGAVTLLVGRLYQQVLRRVASWEEIVWWTDDIITWCALEEAVAFFFNTLDYLSEPRTLDEHVAVLYGALLAREPDVGEQAWGVAYLAGQLAAIEDDVMSSPEFEAYVDRLFP